MFSRRMAQHRSWLPPRLPTPNASVCPVPCVCPSAPACALAPAPPRQSATRHPAPATRPPPQHPSQHPASAPPARAPPRDTHTCMWARQPHRRRAAHTIVLRARALRASAASAPRHRPSMPRACRARPHAFFRLGPTPILRHRAPSPTPPASFCVPNAPSPSPSFPLPPASNNAATAVARAWRPQPLGPRRLLGPSPRRRLAARRSRPPRAGAGRRRRGRPARAGRPTNSSGRTWW